jgi:hypothetical protein
MRAVVTHEALVARAMRDEGEFVARFGPPSLSRPARVFLAALAQRTNGHPWLVVVPDAIEVGATSERRFAAWLDAGTPGLIDAATECMVEDFLGIGGHAVEDDRDYVTYRPGPPPTTAPWTAPELVDRLRWHLTRSPSPYDTVLEDPERVLADFVDAELGDPSTSSWSAFRVDPASLARRTTYFKQDVFPNDGCYGWSERGRLRVLLTNGTD